MHRVHQQVQKQTREEQKNKVSTELWLELAQKMAGVHEETISSAFSQVRDHGNVHVIITDFLVFVILSYLKNLCLCTVKFKCLRPHIVWDFFFFI